MSLKYHYSNPKFDGLPWAVDQKRQYANKKRPKRWLGCIKMAYSFDEVKLELKTLRADFPQCKWLAEPCDYCKQFHLKRIGTTFVKDW